MVSHRPHHMRHDPVASVGFHLYTELQEAIANAEDSSVVLLTDLKLKDGIIFDVPRVTLDLNGHTLEFLPLHIENVTSSDYATIEIAAPEVRICNGRITCTSGASQALRIHTAPHQEYTSTAFLERVEIETEKRATGIVCDGSGVMLTRTSIKSTGAGIHIRGIQSSVGLIDSTVRARRCGIVFQNGRLLAKDSYISAHWSCGIFVNEGNTKLSRTGVRAYRERAIATRLSSPHYGLAYATPHIDIRNDSEICSFPTFALDLPTGTAQIRNSEVRSMEYTAIRLGSKDASSHARLESFNHTVIASWKANGILHLSGVLRFEHTEFKCDRGVDVVQERIMLNASTSESEDVYDAAQAEIDAVGQSVGADETVSNEAVPNSVDEAVSASTEAAMEAPEEEHEDEEASSETSETVQSPDEEQSQDTHASSEADQSSNAQNALDRKPIESINIQHVHEHLHAIKPIRFTGRVDSASSHVTIDFEQWTNGTSVITSKDTRIPQQGTTYRYIIALKAEKGYAFFKRFKLYYHGKRVPYKAMISPNLKTAMITWNLTVDVPKLKAAQRLFL